jgi:hypothetical protein
MGSPFLLLKTLSQSAAGARSNSAGEGGGCWIPFQEDRNAVLSNANRFYFAEQIPQDAKSQTERLTLPKEEGIQDKGSSQLIRPARNRSRRPPGNAKPHSVRERGPEATEIGSLAISPNHVREAPVGFSLPVLKVYNLTLSRVGRMDVPRRLLRRLHLTTQVNTQH